MTENQRNYLADLAGQKGVILQDTDDYSVSRASEMIDELKAMPDATFHEVTQAEQSRINSLVQSALTELRKWGFERGEAA